MLFDPLTDRLHDLAAVAAGHLEEALDPQHVMRADQRREPSTERGSIDDRTALDDETLEIVVVVLALQLVDRRADR